VDFKARRNLVPLRERPQSRDALKKPGDFITERPKAEIRYESQM